MATKNQWKSAVFSGITVCCAATAALVCSASASGQQLQRLTIRPPGSGSVSMCLTPSGKTVAVARDSRKSDLGECVTIWDTTKGEQKGLLKGPSSSTKMWFSLDEKKLTTFDLYEGAIRG